MSKDTKDSKHKPDSLRQPQKRDSLSSIFSAWAALQGKGATSKAPTSSSSSASAQATPGNGSMPRRHSHSASSDSKPKARSGSTRFRRLSFPLSATNQRGPSTKTRHAKTSMTSDPTASPETSKASKGNSCEKVDKAASDTHDGKTSPPPRPQSAGAKPRSPGSPVVMPKSILRVSSPDDHRRPRHFVSPETGEPISSPALSPSSPPGSPSPPTSPIQRPMSPGATVRFAKATIHRVEVGPGRRFLPVKRKSKSTLTYISPLDPGTQQTAPKTMLQSPTKLRRHQQNQAAMCRYWQRTEEEEAQWRAEAERRAQEEAERYRNEPASPVTIAGEADGVVGGGKVEEVDHLPSLDRDGQPPDKLEEVVVESEDDDTDEGAGAKCNLEDETEPIKSMSTEKGRYAGDGSVATKPDAQSSTQNTSEPTRPTSVISPAPPQEPVTENPATATTVTALTPATTAASCARAGTNKSFSERLAEKQAADERAQGATSSTPAPKAAETLSRKASAESSKTARSTSSSPSREQPERPASVPGRSSSSASTRTSTSNSSQSSEEELSRTSTKEKEKERERARDKPRTLSSSSSRSYMSLRPGGDRDRDRDKDRTQKQHSSKSSTGHSNSSNDGGGSGSPSTSTSHNHLHLSGRRGRRYFESHKQGIAV
ncbi:uncharacterized protein P884DRAFT_222738 [Thermothelomyces heterothallicus CBS 202.75]|uniref:uncharacterized protein n=1 Tax=Thermothelomyces heterothallicus CBS 202.75 TaxID=1149848 RepID=UPI003742C2DE